MAINLKSQHPNAPLRTLSHYNSTSLLPLKTKPHEPNSHPLRISDIFLHDQDDDVLMDEKGGHMGGRCFTARRIMGRWLSFLGRGKGKALEGGKKREKVEKGLEEVGKENGDRTVEAGVINGRDLRVSGSSGAGSALESGNSGQDRKDTSFNLGVGSCLLYLVAASRNELSKMVETRKQMEMLLQNIREELQTKDLISMPSEACDLCAYSTTDFPEDSIVDNQLSQEISPTSLVLAKSSSVMVSSQSLIDKTPKQRECLCGIDQLEAELKLELERLAFCLDEEILPGSQQRQIVQLTLEDKVSSKNRSTTSSTVIDPQGVISVAQCGVPPYELERRLHELLESRQQDQIKELETTLECLKNKLHEKEIEVTWWKDTARLIAKHMPEHARLRLQYDPPTSGSQSRT